MIITQYGDKINVKKYIFFVILCATTQLRFVMQILEMSGLLQNTSQCYFALNLCLWGQKLHISIIHSSA